MQRTGRDGLDLVVAVFSSRELLTQALDHLVEVQDTVTIAGAAIVAKARDGEIVVLDDEIGPDEGGIAGGTLGAAMSALGIVQLGALALPGIGALIAIGTAALVGALVGMATGRFALNLIDLGFRREQVRALAAQLQAGHPALVLQIPADATGRTLDHLRGELLPFRAEVVQRLHEVAGMQA